MGFNVSFMNAGLFFMKFKRFNCKICLFSCSLDAFFSEFNLFGTITSLDKGIEICFFSELKDKQLFDSAGLSFKKGLTIEKLRPNFVVKIFESKHDKVSSGSVCS